MHHPSRSTSFLGVACAIAFCSSLLSAQSRLYVDARKPANGNGQSWATAFQRVEDAVDAAKSNSAVQEIWVVFGTYKISKTLDLRAGLDLLGGFVGVETQRVQRPFPPDRTVIDAGGQFRAVQMSSSATVADELIGFTIRGGNYQGSGGGVYCYGGSPTLSELIIEENQVAPSSTFGSASGAGAYFYQGDPVLTDVVFRRNVAKGSGGGLYAYSGDPKLTRCFFIENEALAPNTFQKGRAGGFYCYEGDPVVKDSLFRKNLTDGDGGAFYGYSGSPTFENCVFEFNVGENLGATSDYEGGPTYDRCHFRGNVSTSGGAITRTYKGTLTLRNTMIAGNDGDGLQLAAAGKLDLVNVTLAGNSGYGAVISGSATQATFANSIVWANGKGSFSGGPLVTHSCIQGGYSGTGNIQTDPLLVNAASGNARLQLGSPCFNSGNNASLSNPTLDFEGQPRLFAGTVDMGADEFLPSSILHGADIGQLSVSKGGTINYSIASNAGNANEVFILIPSASGARPIWQLGSVAVPVNFDDVSLLFIQAIPTAFVGILDANGAGKTSLPLPVIPAGLQGFVLTTAPVLFDLSRGVFAAGNDEHIRFVQ